MLTQDDLHDYQKKAVHFQCTHDHSALWLDMGLGKTAITLTSIATLKALGAVNKVIIVAPIRVIHMVWRQEALKWLHTKHLKFSVMTGTKDQRVRALLDKSADIYLINYENLRWLAESIHIYYVSKKKEVPFTGIVWDEISKMKNSATQRVKAVKRILPYIKWTTGLTGTPASNGYKDLHGQYLVLDKGERLGTSKTAFRNRFYQKVGPWKEIPYPDTENIIKGLIGDITLEMSAEDYNPLPDLIINDIELELPQTIRNKYDSLEKEFFFNLDNGKDVEVFNQAALTNKCLQFAAGAVYPISGMKLWEPVHNLKLEALDDIIEESAGKPVLCSYQFRSDAERIMEYFKELRPINLTDCKSQSSLQDAMYRWKNNDCQLMIGHPACLHPDTLVLTERNGWIRLIDVEYSDRVFDGLEFVRHDGCHYAGFKDTIDFFGITMTPDHKILINNKWVEAQNVRNNQKSRDEAIFQWEKKKCCNSKMFSLRRELRNVITKRKKTQQGKQGLSTLYKKHVSLYDEHSYLENMARNGTSFKRYFRQKLRWSWNKSMQGMEKLQKLLSRYVNDLSGWFNYRKNRCEQGLLQGELQMGNQHGTASQQENQSSSYLSRRTNTFSGTGKKVWFQQDDVDNETQSWNDWRPSGERLSEIHLWKKSKTCEHPKKGKTKVYDLVNCGPRHRFLVKNDKGEMFIVKNSMGHGIDGLQSNGNTLVWFGLNWSLDLYEQFNARIRRQGQGVPVICHRLLIKDTLDQAQALSLDTKATTQSQLRQAIKHYRMMKS